MDNAPALAVTGLTKAHAIRAIRYLRNRSMLAFYRKDDKSLNAFVTKFGEDQTYRAMNEAVAATRQ
jgi:hypothetical protein